jgi:microcystin-dependent protein
MHRHSRPHRPTTILATAGALGLIAGGIAHAGPVTGSGVPISTVQPSLGVTYLVRTQDPTNFADIGQVEAFAGSVVPGGFSVANGQLVSIASNPALFSRIGTTYGGDGVTNFALPNLSGRTVVGFGQGAGLTNRNLGSVAGATTETLTANQVPPFGGASGILSASQPVSTLQPSLALNQAIVTQGFFPSPNGTPAQGPVIGQVLTYASSLLPNGRLFANGQQLAINQNQALFSVLGNTYGGTGFTSFALPNLSGRAATEAGSAPGLTPEALGTIMGAETTTLNVANLPPQPLRLSNGTTSFIGGGQPFSVQQPTLGLHYIIATQGVFPTAGTILPDGAPFLGEISLFAGNIAPAGWQFADGQLLSINANPALFAILGNTYGGNGFTAFGLPDLRDRVAVGTGNGVTLGEMFGTDTDTLNFAQLPVGYPSALPQVPEPPTVAILLTALCGLLVMHCRPLRPLPRLARGR